MIHVQSVLPTLAVILASCPFTQSAASSKRGLVYVPSTKYPTDDNIWFRPGSDLTWYYNYQKDPSPAFKDKKIEFVPMLWGTSDKDTGTPFLDSVTAQLDAGANIKYVLGFNEPDGSHSFGGSAIPADLAAATWKREIEPLKKRGINLGAPAVTAAPTGWTWLSQFFHYCNGSCTVDVLPMHWYGNFEGLAAHIGRAVATYPNISNIWITEYAAADQDLSNSQMFFNQTAEMMDRWSNVSRYSYFGSFRSDVSNVGPYAAMLTEKGDLTDIGSWYLGGSATGKAPNGKKSGTDRTIQQFMGWTVVVAIVGLWTVM